MSQHSARPIHNFISYRSSAKCSAVGAFSHAKLIRPISQRLAENLRMSLEIFGRGNERKTCV